MAPSLAPISGRTFAVTSVAISPDGTLLAVGADGSANQAQIWRTDGSNSPVATLTGHTDNVTMVAWSPDGKTLATSSSDRTVRLWTAAGQPIRTLSGHTDIVQNIAWAADGQSLVSASWDKSSADLGARWHPAEDLDRPHRSGLRRGVVARWQTDRLRLARQVDQALATRRDRSSPPSPGIPSRSAASRGRPTVAPSPPGRSTTPCASGVPPVRRSPLSPATPTPSPHWPGSPMAAAWLPGRGTRRSSCGVRDTYPQA